MGQNHSNEVEKGRRRNTALADGFVTGTSGKVEEKYKIDVSRIPGSLLHESLVLQVIPVSISWSCSLSALQEYS